MKIFSMLKPKIEDIVTLILLTGSSILLSGFYAMVQLDSTAVSAYGSGWYGGMGIVISGTLFMLMTVYMPFVFLLLTYVLIKIFVLIPNLVIQRTLLVLTTSLLYFFGFIQLFI